MATPILAGTEPAPMTLADRASQILGDVGDVRAMLEGVQSMLQEGGESMEARLLSMARDRLAETYEHAEALTADLDRAAEVSHHG